MAETFCGVLVNVPDVCIPAEITRCPARPVSFGESGELTRFMVDRELRASSGGEGKAIGKDGGGKWESKRLIKIKFRGRIVRWLERDKDRYGRFRWRERTRRRFEFEILAERPPHGP